MTVSEQIIQVINVLCEKFGIAIDWTSENVIPYITSLCGKLIKFEVCTSILTMVIWVAIIITSIVITKKLYPVFKNGVKENLENYDCGWIILSVFAVIALFVINIVGICIVEQQVTDIIKCVTFPEMYVFEYIQKIVNTK